MRKTSKLINKLNVKNKWEERLLNPRGWRLSKSCYPDEELGFGRRFLYFNSVNVGVSFYDGANLMNEVIDYIRHEGRKNPIVVIERVRLGQTDPWKIKDMAIQKQLVKQGIVDIYDAKEHYTSPKMHKYIMRKIQRDRKKEYIEKINTAVDYRGETWTLKNDKWLDTHNLPIWTISCGPVFKSHWDAIESFLDGEISLEGVLRYNETALFLVAGMYRQYCEQHLIFPKLESYITDVKQQYTVAVRREKLIMEFRNHLHELLLGVRHFYMVDFDDDKACEKQFQLIWCTGLRNKLKAIGGWPILFNEDYRWEISWFIQTHANELTLADQTSLWNMVNFMVHHPMDTTPTSSLTHVIDVEVTEACKKIHEAEAKAKAEAEAAGEIYEDPDPYSKRPAEATRKIHRKYRDRTILENDLAKDPAAQWMLNYLDNLYNSIVSSNADIKRRYAEMQSVQTKVINPLLHNPDKLVNLLSFDKNSPELQKLNSILNFDPLTFQYPFLSVGTFPYYAQNYKAVLPDDYVPKLRHWFDVRVRFREAVISQIQDGRKLRSFRWNGGTLEWEPVYAPSTHVCTETNRYLKLLDDVLCGRISGKQAQLMWTNGSAFALNQETHRFEKQHREYHPFYANKRKFLGSAKRTLYEAVEYMCENVNKLRKYGFRDENENTTAFNLGNKRFRLNCDTGVVSYVRYAYSERPIREILMATDGSPDYIKNRRKNKEDYAIVQENAGKVKRCFYFLQKKRPYEERLWYAEQDLLHAIDKWMAPPKEYLKKIKAEAKQMILDYQIERCKRIGGHLWMDYGDLGGSVLIC